MQYIPFLSRPLEVCGKKGVRNIDIKAILSTDQSFFF